MLICIDMKRALNLNSPSLSLSTFLPHSSPLQHSSPLNTVRHSFTLFSCSVVYLFFCFSVIHLGCSFLQQFIPPFVHLSILPTNHFSLHPSFHPPIPSVHPTVCPSIFHLYVNLSVPISVCPSVSLSLDYK